MEGQFSRCATWASPPILTKQRNPNCKWLQVAVEVLAEALAEALVEVLAVLVEPHPPSPLSSDI